MASAPAASYAQGAAAAQDPAAAQALRTEMEQLRRDFEARMTALEQRVVTLEGGQPPGAAQPAAPAGAAAGTPPPGAPPTAQIPAGAEGAGGPAGSLPVYGNVSAASKIFNPDMAVIGDFLGAAGTNRVQPDPFGPGSAPRALQMHESEASFQAVVDPYARADFFISFGEEGVDLEEGYVSFTTLPGGLLARIGKMRAAFGKVNTLHNHVLPWTDRPLVINNLVAGEDGINDAGLSVARLIPNPWLFLEATGQVYRGDSGDLFHAGKRSDLSYVAHLRGYQDLSESTNIDLGGSYARGHNNPFNPAASGSGTLVAATTALDNAVTLAAPDFVTQLFGIDATLRWRPLQRAIYHSFVGRSEVVWSRRGGPFGDANASGFYVSGDYQVGRRWFTGVRFDRSGRLDTPSLVDKGASFIVTYWPSEFSQVRGQFRRTNYGEDIAANEFLFQFQFAIGAHGAHPF
jgi:hypothetical protein